MKIKLFLIIFLITNLTLSCNNYYREYSLRRAQYNDKEFSNKVQKYQNIFNKLKDSLENQKNDYLIFEVTLNEYQLFQGNATAFFFVRENDRTRIQKLDFFKKYPNDISIYQDIFGVIMPLFNCLRVDSTNVGLQPCTYYKIFARFENKHKEIFSCGLRNNECIDKIIDYLRDYLFVYEMTGNWEFIDDPNILYGK